MKLVTGILLFVITSTAWSQTSPVKFSSLKVMDFFDPSTQQLTGVMIELTASDPASLHEIQLNIQFAETSQLLYIPVTTRNGATEISVAHEKIEFVDKKVTFLMQISVDQTQGYKTLSVKGIDKNNLQVEAINYKRPN